MHLEDDERHYQPYSIEYDWLVTDLTRHNLGSYILIFPEFLITPTRMVSMTGPKLVSHYPPSAWWLKKFVYKRTFSVSVQHPIDSRIHPLSIPNHHSLLLSIYSHCYRRSFAWSHRPGPWSSNVIPGILVSNFPLVLNFPWNSQLIVPYTPDWPSITLAFCCWSFCIAYPDLLIAFTHLVPVLLL